MKASVTCTGLSVHHPNCLLPQLATAGQILLPGNTAHRSARKGYAWEKTTYGHTQGYQGGLGDWLAAD